MHRQKHILFGNIQARPHIPEDLRSQSFPIPWRVSVEPRPNPKKANLKRIFRQQLEFANPTASWKTVNRWFFHQRGLDVRIKKRTSTRTESEDSSRSGL